MKNERNNTASSTMVGMSDTDKQIENKETREYAFHHMMARSRIRWCRWLVVMLSEKMNPTLCWDSAAWFRLFCKRGACTIGLWWEDRTLQSAMSAQYTTKHTDGRRNLQTWFRREAIAILKKARQAFISIGNSCNLVSTGMLGAVVRIWRTLPSKGAFGYRIRLKKLCIRRDCAHE